MANGDQLGCYLLIATLYKPKVYKDILHKVCDDHFDKIDAESACLTLGYTGGSYQTRNQPNWSLNEVPILMDDVACASSQSNFLECSRSDTHNCGHNENVLLVCHLGEFQTFWYLNTTKTSPFEIEPHMFNYICIEPTYVPTNFPNVDMSQVLGTSVRDLRPRTRVRGDGMGIAQDRILYALDIV